MSKCNLPVSLPVDQWPEVTEEMREEHRKAAREWAKQQEEKIARGEVESQWNFTAPRSKEEILEDKRILKECYDHFKEENFIGACKVIENNIISWDSDEGFSVGVVKEAFNREIEYAEDIHNPMLAKCYEQAQIYVALHE